ncbi:zinc metalloprotease, partial [Corynebacterium minutissimum]|nr:zinc metalloprotease [Corynebacterium minutissimum]
VSNPLDNLIAEKPAAKPAGKPQPQPAEQPTGQQQPQRSQQQPQRSQEQGARPAPFGAPRSSQGQAPAFRPMGEPRREDQPAQPTQTPQPTRSAQAPKPAQSAQSVKRAADGPSTETTTQQQPEFKTDSFQAVQWNQGAAGAQHVKEDAGSAQPHHRHRKPEAGSAQQAAPTEGTRGRRRSDEHREGAVSVAELMARSKRGKEQRNKDEKK